MSQMQTMERPYRIDIQQYGVPYGLLYRRTEPGYVLADGTVLLESERDEYGRYRGGAGRRHHRPAEGYRRECIYRPADFMRLFILRAGRYAAFVNLNRKAASNRQI